ncbi:hypothetical protein [Sphingomonas daechungensis]|uniref:hypothetical protein n=1 Tax=Sphingomonas daechungensis TaxID=1176646 RepID=UPI001CB8B526|nr:hypothetical protein [Sphingomonas daechungensis]
MAEHILLAILIQLLVRFISGSWWAGAAAACAWFISREIAQAEYRWIEYFGSGLRANMPWWGASIRGCGTRSIPGSTGFCLRS